MALSLESGLCVAERYRLVRELSRGGMGCVWVAHHLALDTPCVLKFISSEAARLPDLPARFAGEAKAAARLRSPYVVQMLDHGVCDGVPFMAMELLEGEDLGKRLGRVGRLPPDETVALLTQVARGLGKAHAAGIVHRDLKPENVFLVRDDDRDHVKILDFGVAKSLGENLLDGVRTSAGALLGTPYYMSPEQAEGTGVVDHRADLWSLAVIAFRCMTGRLPFESKALGELLVKIMYQPVPVPSALAPNVPLAFDAWWARAAARPPQERFQSARELVEALADALLVQPAVLGPKWTPLPVDHARHLTPTEILESAPGAIVGKSATLSAQPVCTTVAKPAQRRFVWAATIALLVTGAGIYAMRGFSASAEIASQFVEPVAGIAPVEEAVDEASPIEEPPSVADAGTPELPPAARGSAVASAPRPPVAKKLDCSNPFIVDERGIKRVRRECL